MPSSEASLRLTDRYQQQLIAQRTRATAAMRSTWRLVDESTVEQSYGAWAVSAAALITETQRSGISASRLYLAAFIASELGRTAGTPAAGDIGRFAGLDRFGRALERALTPPLQTIRAALAGGYAATQALTMGRHRALRIGADAMAAAPRNGLLELLHGSREVSGWRRVATGNETCGACLADATGKAHPLSTRLRFHTSCDCVQEPVISGARDNVQRPTGRELFDAMTVAEQNAMFAGRGGAAKAQLIRTGKAAFEDLISPDPRVLGPDGITETPMAALA